MKLLCYEVAVGHVVTICYGYAKKIYKYWNYYKEDLLQLMNCKIKLMNYEIRKS